MKLPPHFTFALLAALALALSLPPLTQAQDSAAPAKPNIIVILVDDMGWSNIGCYGGFIETPHIDGMAALGVRFNQFYNAARCCPTRASIMTGLHPHQAGIGHMTIPVRPMADPETGEAKYQSIFTKEERRETQGIPYAYQGWMDEAIPTLPEMLKGAGYATYMSGKWHLAAPDESTWPTQRGFDRYYGHLAGGSDFFAPQNLYRDNQPIEPEGADYYTTDAFTDEAIAMLRDHEAAKDDEPFFLYLAYNAPHFPMQAMPNDYEKYRGRFLEGWDKMRAQKLEKQIEMGLVPENTQLPVVGDSPKRDGNSGEAIPAWDSLSKDKQNEMDAIMATYAGMVDRVDQNVGKLLGYLTQTGEINDTLIFFLSDNGGEAETGPLGDFKMEDLGEYGKGGWKYGKAWATLSNTPFREYKHFTHQGGIQTPLVVQWPAGIKEELQGSIITQYGYLPDLVETCMDLAGATRPTEKNDTPVPLGDGQSMAAILKGETAPLHDEPICIEHEGNRVVRDGKWKLVAYFDQPWELYDLEADFAEATDLAQDQPEVVTRLSAFYHQWADKVGVIDWETAKEYSVYNKKYRAGKKILPKK